MQAQSHGPSRKWILILVLVALIAIGLGVFKTVGSQVEQVYPRRGPVLEAVYGLGTVLATQTFELRTGVTTEIQRFYVKAGDEVKKGAPLARLGEQGTVNAPFSGTVTQVAYKEGEIVFALVPVLKLENLSDRYIQVSLEQQGALRVRKGLKARLVFESLRGKRFEGTVRSVFPSEGQFLTDIVVENLPSEVLPGMTTDVAIEIARKEDALMIPVAGIAGGRVVLRRPDGHQEKIPVEIGVVDGEWAELVSPALSLDDAVIVKRKEP